MFIAAKMTHGDRLGHSWRAGRLLFPGPRLRSRRHDPRRARAPRGDRRARLSRTRARLAGRRSTATTPIRRPAAISSPPTTPKAWWCGRTPPPTTPSPNPNAVAAQNLVRLAGLTGQHAWRDQADRLFDGVLAARGREPVRARGAAQRARSAPARRRDRRRRPGDARGRASRGRAASCRSSIASCCARRPPTALPPTHPAQAKIAAASDAAAFVCVGETCSLPVTTPDAIAGDGCGDAALNHELNIPISAFTQHAQQSSLPGLDEFGL